MNAHPNMATITASLERSLQNCSLNNHRRQGGGTTNSASSDSSENHVFNHNNNSSSSDDAALELNSEISLPYHWEQCLDLKTGEIYYINWRTGMKVKEDPRTNHGEEVYGADNLYYSEDDEEEEEDDENSYDSEGSTSEESSFSSTRQPQITNITTTTGSGKSSAAVAGPGPVLVVGGCKTCLMYFMVPKEVDDCPKCCGQLLHFDQN